ncbi:MAG: alpha/beta hydrolase [Rhodopirellula sp.]|nr:alpha/beta hydrolase [Rhodopirellula sp.]
MLRLRIRNAFLCTLVVSTLGAAAISWYVGGKLVAPNKSDVGTIPVGLSGASISLETNSGMSVNGWHIPSTDATATVILLHPIRGDRRSMQGRAAMLGKAGYSTLLIDLPSHGESDGEMITFGWRERHAVSAAVKFVKEQNPKHRVAIVGWSLGGAAALFASPLEVDAIVLESVYSKVTKAVHNRVNMRVGWLHHVVAPCLTSQVYLRLGVTADELSPVDYVAAVDCPLLVLAGDMDGHTTLAESKEMYAAAVEPKQLFVFEGAVHEDLYQYDPASYDEAVVSFLNTWLD